VAIGPLSVLLVSLLSLRPGFLPKAIAQQIAPAQPSAHATGEVMIESDRQMADNRTGVVTAAGNVRILYPEQRVTATTRQAQYYSREGRVVLSGDVEVVQVEGHSIQAEQLLYNIKEQRLEASPMPGAQVISRYNLSAPAPGGGIITP
jgi:lipopolysaccharide export system protein LptA